MIVFNNQTNMFSNSMMNDQTNITQLIHNTRSRTGSNGGKRLKNDDDQL